MSKSSVTRLKKFLRENYIERKSMGSPNMSSAIRDMLTDLLHLGDDEKVKIFSRLCDAQEVYEIEKEMSSENGVFCVPS